MRGPAAIAVVAISAAVTAPGLAETAPSLRLSDRTPVTIAGVGFGPTERVRVTLLGPPSSKRLIRASRRGSFVIRFQTATASRCDLVRVIAIGAGGSRAVLKVLPAPACLPSRSP